MKIGKNRNIIFLGVLIAIALILVWKMGFTKNSKPNDLKVPEAETGIVARGHIEPDGSVLALQGPMSGGVVRHLLVAVGSKVIKGQPLAYLEGYDTHFASVQVAEKAVKYYAIQQRQSIDGAKQSTIDAQQSVVEAKKVVALRAKRDFDRLEALFADQLVSRQALDRAVADRDIAGSELDQAKKSLAALSEFREVDRDVAEARVAIEVATVVKAKSEMERTIVRAPIDGTVLSIFARDGEAIGESGIMRIANLDQLNVIAEVDENFVSKIRLGGISTIQGSLINSPIQATVISIGKEVFKQKRPHYDTLVGRDARIVEIRLKSSIPLPVVIGGEVEVRFAVNAK